MSAATAFLLGQISMVPTMVWIGMDPFPTAKRAALAVAIILAWSIATYLLLIQVTQ